MSPRPPPEDLLPWALDALGAPAENHRTLLEDVAGDASNRRYYRLRLDDSSYIAAVAPPETEKNAEFLAVREMFERASISVPALYAADLQRGYLLLGDLGHGLLLAQLNEDSADSCYHTAFGVLHRLARLAPEDPNWPAYDEALLNEELSRFPQWFVQEMLGHTMSEAELELWTPFSQLLVSSALAQPRVLVHRDFHSRNLMPQVDGSLGVIDFQDAVTGPITYDLVSLLRDCYIRWPANQVEEWALAYCGELLREGLLEGVSAEQFLRWFDWMGLQRHLKVLGTFARLYLRDGKDAYLQDLPLVLAYVEEILQKYRSEEPIIEAFSSWFSTVLAPLIEQQPWSKTA